MATHVELPQLSDTMTEGVLVAWLVKEGDNVRTGDPIADVETDKAIMNVDAPTDGIVLRQHVAEGDTVPIGAVVATIGAVGEDVPPVEAAPAPASVVETPTEQPPEPAVAAEEPAEHAPDTRERLRVSPVARKLAAEAGLPLDGLHGTGPEGRIVKRDVVAARGAAASAPTPASGSRLAPISSRRKLMISRLEELARTVPTFTVSRDVDMDPAWAFRESLKKTRTFAEGIGFNEIIIRAATIAMREVPELNATYTPAGIRCNDEVHVGLAVGLEDVVAVPVVRNAHSRSLAEVSAEVRRLTEQARSGSLLAYDLGKSTFTISNLGMYGVDRFTAVLNPPEAGILAVGAIVRKPRVVGDSVAVGREMSVTLTVDHRVADGVRAALWLGAFAGCLEDPVTLLVD